VRLRWKWRYLGMVLGLTMLAFGGFVRWRVASVLHSLTEAVEAQQKLKFSVRQLSPTVTNGVEWISASTNFTQAAVFQGKFYVASPSGLLEYDLRGTLLKQYRAGIELPASPLLRMATGVLNDAHQPELLMATAGEGVLAFNGHQFRQIRPEEPEARTIMSILPLNSGRLLIGTLKHGLLVYDGKELRVFHPTLAGISVTELAGSEADLWIGTLDQGVVHWQGGQSQPFGEAQGMPDSRVYSILVTNDKTYVGTALGVAEFDQSHFARVLAAGTFAQALYLRGSKLLVGSLDQGITQVEIGLNQRRIAPPLGEGGSANPKINFVRQIFAANSELYALAEDSLYSWDQHGGWNKVLSPQSALLADRNVSALAVDSRHRLWVGYFNRGLDLVDAGGKTEHIEDDNVFCVNRIVTGISKDVTAVATANGLVLFDSSGRRQQVLGRKDGLISDHVTDVAAYGNGLAIATPAGLTFLDASGPRSLYAFHGLVNNHIYTLAARGNQVLAGTLGGISVLDHEQVIANYTTATSGLKHNWISAVAAEGNGWIIGTYGAGVERLSQEGKVETFETASSKFDVNPNAVLVTQKHVFAGSLEHGLYSQNRESGRWTIIAEGLPSRNVTALAADNGYIYIGTDNGLVRLPEQNLP
jgi:ligand-binding sensor domain-containing protein